ncbi:MAG: DUF4386 domain-containing protein [Candidatus Thorarchaeota archaeon]|nr:DUF4386 domain-containing protein [Candidatus Thorarchaeota archaeon]
MNSDIDENFAKILGAVFLLQASAPLIGGLIRDSIIGTGDITEIMNNVSNSAWLMQLGIAVELIAAIGVVMLGGLLYLLLKRQDAKIALVAMVLYIIEVVALIISQVATAALLLISQDSVTAGHPAYLQTLGTLFLEIHDFVFGSVLMLFFALGATMFYYLFYKSGHLPKGLALFGLTTAVLSLLSILITIFGIVNTEAVMIVFLLNLPFELGTGLWLLVKGIRVSSESK